MEHYLDILVMLLIILGAGIYLYKTFKRSRAGCGSICSGCSSSCKTKPRQFKTKTIQLKKIA